MYVFLIPVLDACEVSAQCAVIMGNAFTSRVDVLSICFNNISSLFVSFLSKYRQILLCYYKCDEKLINKLVKFEIYDSRAGRCGHITRLRVPTFCRENIAILCKIFYVV